MSLNSLKSDMLEALLINEISGNPFGAAKQMQIEIEEFETLKNL